MSKAFTREPDDSSAEEIAPLRPDAARAGNNYITRQGLDRLRHQVDGLLEKRRVLQSKPGHGDTSASVRRIDLEIQKLQQTLNSVIVAGPPADKEKIAFGASVLVRDANGEEETWQIVGLDEAEPAEGRISAASPLGQALLNKKAGEKTRFQTPGGEHELTIVQVSYRLFGGKK